MLVQSTVLLDSMGVHAVQEAPLLESPTPGLSVDESAPVSATS
jgi:hypothetical protein